MYIIHTHIIQQPLQEKKAYYSAQAQMFNHSANKKNNNTRKRTRKREKNNTKTNNIIGKGRNREERERAKRA